MNKKIVLPVTILIGVLLLFAVLSVFTGRIPENDNAAVGNTGGNLLNGGYFCEDDGVVYFSNSYDNGCLYSMNPDGTDLKRLTRTSVNYINAEGNYLYYYQNDKAGTQASWAGRGALGVYRSNKTGTRTSCLKRTASGVVSLAGNHLFFQNYNNTEGMTLYRTDFTGKEKEQVLDAIIDPSCVVNGAIYYAGTEGDHNLYRFDTGSLTTSLVLEGRFWNPIVSGDTVYYMNVSDDYRLCRRSLSGGEETVLTQDRVDTYNITEEYIYYQKNSADAPALMRMRLDGSDPEVIINGNFSDINVTSQYVYFHEFENNVPIYRTPSNGALQPEPFFAAQDAASVQ